MMSLFKVIPSITFIGKTPLSNLLSGWMYLILCYPCGYNIGLNSSQFILLS
jgi:hypothetical protein